MGDKYHVILFFIILLNIISFIQSIGNVIIPLYYSENIKKLNYIEFLLQPQLYGKLKLGSPEQIIYLLITTDTNYFSIESNPLNNKFYAPNKSSTFVKSNNDFTFYEENYKSGFYCTDQFYFINDINKIEKEELYNNVTFMYINEFTKPNTFIIDANNNELTGIIGLQYPKSYPIFNILKALKDRNIITKNIWSIIYIDSHPYLIIGENPYMNDNIEEKRTNSYSTGYYNYWYLFFNDIKIANTKLNEERVAQYSPQLGVIIGVKEYKNYIKKNFFNDLINNNKCFEKSITINGKTYTYFECDVDINLSNFEKLEFIHQELSYIFILDKNDLFIDVNGKKYFLCIFPEDYSYQKQQNWILGTPFVKKYNFVFDQDIKKILFYDDVPNIKSNYQSSKISGFTITIIIILSLITFLIFLYIIIKIIFKPKQIKANELEDSFNYKTEENLDNKEIKNSFENSKYNSLGI